MIDMDYMIGTWQRWDLVLGWKSGFGPVTGVVSGGVSGSMENLLVFTPAPQYTKYWNKLQSLLYRQVTTLETCLPADW